METTEIKKLTSIELTEVKELHKEINDLLMNIGNAELVKNQLISKHIELQETWKSMTTILQEKYGSGNINLDDGVLSPSTEEDIYQKA